MAELKLSTEEMAMSAFRVFCYASGVAEPNWDHQSDEEQGRWLQMARRAERALESLIGKSYNQAARALCELWSDNPLIYEGLAYPLQLSWNATARHLAAVIDSDEIDSLDATERFWGDWARERSKKS